MDRFITKTVRVKTSEELPPTKRISTPAGQRLSVIVDRTKSGGPTIPPKSENWWKGKPLAGLNETSEDLSYSSPYGSVDTQISALKKEEGDHHNERKRRKWRKILIYLSIALLLVLAIAIGLGLGLKKTKSNGYAEPEAATENPPDNSPPDALPPDALPPDTPPSGVIPPKTPLPSKTTSSKAQHRTNAGIVNSSKGVPSTAAESGSAKPGKSSPTSVSQSSPTNTAKPPGFPLGRYSMVTFLDTAASDCISDAKIWTCDPGTTYNDNRQRSMTTFNWEIGGSENAYTISSMDVAPAAYFLNAPLKLVDGGKDSEHYRFQVTMDKETQPELMMDGSLLPASCFFNSTTFQAYLYTKQASTYPDNTVLSHPPNTPWPFRIRVEEVIGAAENVPACYRTHLIGLGGELRANVTAQDPSQLCSCLYKNWRTGT